MYAKMKSKHSSVFNMASPIYIFSGFLDSGKTSLILDTLSDEGFMESDSRTLILSFEEGEEEYDREFLKEHNAFLVQMDDIEELTVEKALELDTLYHPTQVFVEYNGSQPLNNDVFLGIRDFWPVVQILSTVDATTFSLYVNNMRSMLFEQLRYSDCVIVNRCTEDTDAIMIRGNIKAMNRAARIFYEGEHGQPANLKGGVLPFDINAEVIDIKDDDYGLWYMDAIEDPSKYNEKTIILRGQFDQKLKGYESSFIMGRKAMVCCDKDTSSCSITVTGITLDGLEKDQWLEVKGILRTVPVEEGGETLVLYAKEARYYNGPEDPYVYFN